MALGTISILVGIVLLVFIEFFFKKDLDEGDVKYSVCDGPDFEGTDGLSGTLGLNSEDIGPFQRNNNAK